MYDSRRLSHLIACRDSLLAGLISGISRIFFIFVYSLGAPRDRTTRPR